MPKLLIIAACLVNFGDDRGGVDVAPGDITEVPRDTAKFLVENERALYIDAKEDHSKPARYTAESKLVDQARALAKARAKAEKDPPPPPPPPAP